VTKAGFERAAAMLTSVVSAESPGHRRMVHARHTLLQEGRYRESIERFRKALELKPDYDIAVINMAHAYRRWETTRPLWRDTSAISRSIPGRLRTVPGGRGLPRPRDIDRAEQVFRQTLALDPKVASATNALGVIAFQRRISRPPRS